MKTALVLGGTRFFGKRLVQHLVENGVSVTLGTRGLTPDSFGEKVKRIALDRTDHASLEAAIADTHYDVVYDNICYTPAEALFAVEVFAGKVGRYIFTSSLSVYSGSEEAQPETCFDPYTYPIELGELEKLDYAEGKRLAEACLLQKASFPVIAVRFPIVMGTDDYTERLLFHTKRIQDGEGFGIQNPDAKMCFISSEEAARFLFWLGDSELTGPVNACADGTLTVTGLLHQIETQIGKQAILISQEEEPALSPYSPKTSWYMNTDKAKQAGFQFSNLQDWLPNLIRQVTQ